jgi:hypothetical protein
MRDENWIVIGDVNADPIIFDITSKAVYMAMHGQGLWDLKQVSESLDKFCMLMASWTTLIIGEYDKEVLDEEFILKQCFMDKLSTKLTVCITAKEQENFYSFF